MVMVLGLHFVLGTWELIWFSIILQAEKDKDRKEFSFCWLNPRSLSKCLRQLRLGQAEARSLKLRLLSPSGKQESTQLPGRKSKALTTGTLKWDVGVVSGIDLFAKCPPWHIKFNSYRHFTLVLKMLLVIRNAKYITTFKNVNTSKANSVN